jgi:hypothetical protein
MMSFYQALGGLTAAPERAEDWRIREREVTPLRRGYPGSEGERDIMHSLSLTAQRS